MDEIEKRMWQNIMLQIKGFYKNEDKGIQVAILEGLIFFLKDQIRRRCPRYPMIGEKEILELFLVEYEHLKN